MFGRGFVGFVTAFVGYPSCSKECEKKDHELSVSYKWPGFCAFSLNDISFREEAGSMVTLTDSAVSTLQRVLTNSPAAQGLRIQVADGGCAGLKYQMGLEADATEGDTVLEFGSVKVFVDAGSMVHLDGVVVDYVEGIQGSSFKFDNSNATSTCGCGSSFSTSSCSTKPAEAGQSCGSGHHRDHDHHHHH
jgi:iron-sulfur cluster assembly protein